MFVPGLCHPLVSEGGVPCSMDVMDMRDVMDVKDIYVKRETRSEKREG